MQECNLTGKTATQRDFQQSNFSEVKKEVQTSATNPFMRQSERSL